MKIKLEAKKEMKEYGHSDEDCELIFSEDGDFIDIIIRDEFFDEKIKVYVRKEELKRALTALM
jgi:hypothetical protein